MSGMKLMRNPTSQRHDELCEQLDKIVNCEYSVIEHFAGIRSTVKDRRPFIGIHPENNLVGIFNGLGTKGASLAPYFANQFADFLEDGAILDDEVNIKRFLGKINYQTITLL